MKKPLPWQKAFALISVGQIFSIIGSSAAQFAIIWWLTVKTGSALTLSIASVAGFLPQAVIGIFAGVWVDRYDRKKIMMLADGFVALSSALLAIAFLMGRESIPLIYVILGLRSVGGAFHAPAFTSMIPMFVPPDQLMKAGGWTRLASSGSALLGPAIGAFLMGLFSLEAIMLVDIVGAIFAILTLSGLSLPASPPVKGKLNIMGDMKKAFTCIAQNKALVTVLPSLLVVVMAVNPLASLLPLMVSTHFQGGVWHNSLVEICFSAGTLIGSAAMGIWASGKNKFAFMSLACLSVGSLGIVSGLLSPSLFPLFVAIIFVIGICESGLNVPIIAYIQGTIDTAQLGKVMSLIMSLIGFSVPVGMAIAGPVAEYLGIGTWFIIAGGLTICAGASIWILARKYDFVPTQTQPQGEIAGD